MLATVIMTNDPKPRAIMPDLFVNRHTNEHAQKRSLYL